MASLLHENDSSDDVSGTNTPDKRRSHECALVDDHLHLFGGYDGSKYLPRNEIFVMNIRRAAERKWIRRLTRGRTIPPPCIGARCVVIEKMVYSYGGITYRDSRLGIVYRLDPKKMEWIEVTSTSMGGKIPHERSCCSLCAIGSRMIMFGGDCGREEISRERLQSGASQNKYNWSNDAYEFRLEEGNEIGVWLDLKLSGKRPKPLIAAAMATIDQHRALLYGKDVRNKTHSLLIDLNQKAWTTIYFNVKPSPRHNHTICQLVTERLKNESICLLVGGGLTDEKNSDYVFVLDCKKSKAYEMEFDSQLGKVRYHTCHCVKNEDDTADVIICGGRDSNEETYMPLLSAIHLDGDNESYMRIEREIFLSRRASVLGASPSPPPSLPGDSHDVEVMQRELDYLRRRRSELAKEKSALREKVDTIQRLVHCKDEELAQIRRDFAAFRLESEADRRRFQECLPSSQKDKDEELIS